MMGDVLVEPLEGLSKALESVCLKDGTLVNSIIRSSSSSIGSDSISSISSSSTSSRGGGGDHTKDQLDLARSDQLPHQIHDWFNAPGATANHQDEMYERILSHIDAHSIDEVKRILTILCVAERPLTLTEVNEAVAVDLGITPTFDPALRFADESDIVRICRGLVETSQGAEYETQPKPGHASPRFLRIAHSSVQEYLQSDRIHAGEASFFGIQSAAAHKELFDICHAYLLDPALSRATLTEDIFHERPLCLYAATYWSSHYQQQEGAFDGADSALELLTDNANHFLNWVRISAPDHVDRGPDLQLSWDSIGQPLYYAALLGLDTLISKMVDLETEVEEMSTGFHGADSTSTHLSSFVNAQRGRGGSALYAASSRGHIRTVQALLEHGASVNAPGGWYGTALRAASSEGHVDVVRLLLAHDADVNAVGPRRAAALITASLNGHAEIVRLLLDHNADVNAQAGPYGNALCAASLNGHARTVQVLLDHKSSINMSGEWYRFAHKAASAHGHADILQLLSSKHGGNKA